MIIRKRYLDQIRPFIDKPFVKAITGVRRCGKSTFLQQIAGYLYETGIKKQNILVINKELLEFDFIKTYNELHQHIHNYFDGKTGSYYLFVDEIQEIESWERCIASLIAENRTDIYITGSNARLLSSDLATLLTGRYIQVTMLPFSFNEFFEMISGSEIGISRNTAFDRFVRFGGFPGIHSLNWEEIPVRQFLESLYNTILLKDIVMKYNIRDVYMLDKVAGFLISNSGSITSANKLSAYVKSQHRKISVDTVQSYITYSCNAMLTHQIKRFDLKGKCFLESHDKYFPSDVGLRYAVMGFPPGNLSGNLENIVLNDLISRGYKVFIGKANELEVDFIAEKGNEKQYFQVCTSLKEEKSIEREYKPFECVHNHFPKYVLSLDDAFDTSLKGVRWMNIMEFLLKE